MGSAFLSVQFLHAYPCYLSERQALRNGCESPYSEDNDIVVAVVESSDEEDPDYDVNKGIYHIICRRILLDPAVFSYILEVIFVVGIWYGFGFLVTNYSFPI